MAAREGTFAPPTAPPGARPVTPARPGPPPRRPDEPVWGIVALAAALAPLPLWLFGDIQDVALMASLLGAVVAIVFGAVGISKTKNADSMTGRGLAIAGLVLGILELVAAVLFVLIAILVFAAILAACLGCGGSGAFGVGLAGGRRSDWRAFLTAHHPATGACEADVFWACGRGWCVGCTVGLGVALVALGGLWLVAPTTAWWAFVAVGLVAGSAQVVSVAGWARSRPAKVTVKGLVGGGLALTMWGLLQAPFGTVSQAAGVAALCVVILLSGVPRARRLARVAAKRRAARCGPAPHPW